MKNALRRTVRAVAVAGLVLGGTGLTAAAASASTPDATAKLHACDYTIEASPVRVWEYPGGSSRKGNVALAHTESVPFDSIPLIISATVGGQKWVYGEIIPFQGGSFGWVGQDYLKDAVCGTQTYQTTNTLTAKVSLGDPFASEPSEISASYRGQTWVWGIDAFASHRAGWVGRKYLTLDSCDSSGCFYNVKTDAREWVLPGGSSGP